MSHIKAATAIDAEFPVVISPYLDNGNMNGSNQLFITTYFTLSTFYETFTCTGAMTTDSGQTTLPPCLNPTSEVVQDHKMETKAGFRSMADTPVEYIRAVIALMFIAVLIKCLIFRVNEVSLCMLRMPHTP